MLRENRGGSNVENIFQHCHVIFQRVEDIQPSIVSRYFSHRPRLWDGPFDQDDELIFLPTSRRTELGGLSGSGLHEIEIDKTFFARNNDGLGGFERYANTRAISFPSSIFGRSTNLASVRLS